MRAAKRSMARWKPQATPRSRCACRSRAACRSRRGSASEGGGDAAWRSLLKPRPFAGERLVQFTQQLATLLGAGQPLDRALTILLELPEDAAARRTIAEVRDAVRSGTALSRPRWSASTARSRGCTSTWCARARPAAVWRTRCSGWPTVERSRLLRARVVNALIYPAILLVMVGLSLLMFLLGYVVPQFAAMYESLDAPLPLFTRLVLGVGLFVRDWWILLLVVPALAAWCCGSTRRLATPPSARVSTAGCCSRNWPARWWRGWRRRGWRARSARC